MINHSINSLQEMQRLKHANCWRDVISIICTEVTGQTQPLPQEQRLNEAPQEAMWGAGGPPSRSSLSASVKYLQTCLYFYIIFHRGKVRNEYSTAGWS